MNIQDWLLLGFTGLISFYKNLEKQTILVMFLLIQSLETHFPDVFYEEIVTSAPKS